ncbi:MAG: LysM peptidoglycan-binding domain-containing protein [Anaerolineales bacterium]
MHKTALVLSLCVLLLAAFGSVSAQAPDDCVNTVMVWDNDTLTSIAAREDVSVNELAQLNNLSPNARLRIGQVLCTDGLVSAQPMPDDDDMDEEPASETDEDDEDMGTGGPLTDEPTPSGNFVRGQDPNLFRGWRTHTVTDDDTLFGISQQYDEAISQIAQANNIDNLQLVFVGEALLIPPVEGTLPPPLTGGGTDPETQPPATGGVHQPPPDTIPNLSITPRTAGPGDTVTVSGSNYPGNTEVVLYLDKPSQNLRSDALESVQTAADGTFTTMLEIPQTWDGTLSVTQPTVSISGYAQSGGYWAMNYFVNDNR